MAELAKKLGETYHDQEKLISGVARHLALKSMTQAVQLYGVTGAVRADDRIHPSEAVKENWCPRNTYYRISGAPMKIDNLVPQSMAMEIVYEIGNEIQTKWNTWFREMKALRGLWRCLDCGLLWEDVSPEICPRCEAGTREIIYNEVPVSKDEYLLEGSADGDVYNPFLDAWRLIECKSIGVGTIRVEAPSLLKNHSTAKGEIDLYGLWRAIRRPFPSHIRQGMIYCFCADRNEIVYIYESKFVTTWPKEFELKFQHYLIEDILDECKTVKNALDAGRPPKRPHWAELSSPVCLGCPYLDVCWGERRSGATAKKVELKN